MESFSITNDCCTSRSNDPYISLTTQFVDKEFYRYGINFAKKLLAFVEYRFPNCGTEKHENCAANFLDPNYKLKN